jgi:hypothetical protein
VTAELDRACLALDGVALEVAAWVLQERLLRARVANNRMPSGAGRF